MSKKLCGTLIVVLFSAVAAAQSPWDIVIFDGNDERGEDWYEASAGSFGGGSTLKLVGEVPWDDKMPIDTLQKYEDHESGEITWKSASGGDWQLFVADDCWIPHNADGYDTLVLLLNAPVEIDSAYLPKVGLEDVDDHRSSLLSLGDFVSGIDGEIETWDTVSIPLDSFKPYNDFEPFKLKAVWFSQGEADDTWHTLWVGDIRVVCDSVEPFSLDSLEKASFNFFWYEVDSSSGLIRDKTDCNVSSIASIGFGLTAIGIAEKRGWIDSDLAKERVRLTLATLFDGPQDSLQSGYIGYKGFFYHLLNMDTRTRDGTSELSSIDTALLMAGILFVRSYFDDTLDVQETEIRLLADSLYKRVDWNWMLDSASLLLHMAWSPESSFSSSLWHGYNEAMILYLLAIGSPTHPIPASSWPAWCSTYVWDDSLQFVISNDPCNPLFLYQYSHCWIDFRGRVDTCCAMDTIDYFENSRRATLANRGYCRAQPWPCYHDSSWGLTASDGPNSCGIYKVRGPDTLCDDGTIAPTAAGGSIVFTPAECSTALNWMYDSLGARLWGPYGFRDAYNCTDDWFSRVHIGIDQGPIVLMIENYRSELVWEYFMKNEEIQNALDSACFVTGIEGNQQRIPSGFYISQNLPNPFDSKTMISYQLPEAVAVTLRVYNPIGQKVRELVNELQKPGRYHIWWDGKNSKGKLLPSGVYFYDFKAGDYEMRKKMILVR